MSRTDCLADGRRANRQSHHGLLRGLPQGQEGVERLPDVSFLMDRRSFIKLTAVTGGATAIAACTTGSPENELIRFIPDEDLTPGIAEIKNGVCPICRAGCGTTVRVMQGGADVVRNRQRGGMTMSLAKNLEGNPTHPTSHGALLPPGPASIQ